MHRKSAELSDRSVAGATGACFVSVVAFHDKRAKGSDVCAAGRLVGMNERVWTTNEDDI